MTETNKICDENKNADVTDETAFAESKNETAADGSEKGAADINENEAKESGDMPCRGRKHGCRRGMHHRGPGHCGPGRGFGPCHPMRGPHHGRLAGPGVTVKVIVTERPMGRYPFPEGGFKPCRPGMRPGMPGMRPEMPGMHPGMPGMHPGMPFGREAFPGRHHRPMPDPDSLMGLWIRSHKALERMPADHRGVRRVLRLLDLGGGSLSQRELTELMGVKPGSLSELLGKMEARGLISRIREEEDRRKVTVSLTEAGKEKAGRRGRRDLFAALSEEEKEQLKAILAKLTAAWEKQPEAKGEANAE